MQVDEFGGPELKACLRQVFEAAGFPDIVPIQAETVVRVFSPGAVVALHGDPDLKLVSTISGETIWWAHPPEEMSTAEHEGLLRWQLLPRLAGGRRHGASDTGGPRLLPPLALAPLADPPRRRTDRQLRGRFLDTRGPPSSQDPDMNWMLRRLRVKPLPPGNANDGRKCRVFDGICTITRKGLPYRGI